MNVLLLLGTVIGVAGLMMAAVFSFAIGSRARAAMLGVGALSWAGLYGACVLVASLLSHETLLPAGTTKRFCGFYLDCHLGVAVLADATPPTIAGRVANGTWHVLTLQFSSNARKAALKPYDLRIEMVAGTGEHYWRDLTAEAAMAGGRLPELARSIPAGGAYSVPVVFDLPRGIVAPRLFVGEGLGIDRAIEGVLLGDEDSFLHRKTLLSLPRASGGQDVSIR